MQAKRSIKKKKDTEKQALRDTNREKEMQRKSEKAKKTAEYAVLKKKNKFSIRIKKQLFASIVLVVVQQSKLFLYKKKQKICQNRMSRKMLKIL